MLKNSKTVCSAKKLCCPMEVCMKTPDLLRNINSKWHITRVSAG